MSPLNIFSKFRYFAFALAFYSSSTHAVTTHVKFVMQFVLYTPADVEIMQDDGMMHVYTLLCIHFVIPASTAVVIIDDDKMYPRMYIYIIDNNVPAGRVVHGHLTRAGTSPCLIHLSRVSHCNAARRVTTEFDRQHVFRIAFPAVTIQYVQTKRGCSSTSACFFNVS